MADLPIDPDRKADGVEYALVIDGQKPAVADLDLDAIERVASRSVGFDHSAVICALVAEVRRLRADADPFNLDLTADEVDRLRAKVAEQRTLISEIAVEREQLRASLVNCEDALEGAEGAAGRWLAENQRLRQVEGTARNLVRAVGPNPPPHLYHPVVALRAIFGDGRDEALAPFGGDRD